MELFRTSRQSQIFTKRNVLGVIAALWVGLGIQPCAVAAVSDHGCPHCPPALEQDAARPNVHCASEIPQFEESCVSAQAECCDIDEGTVDVRSGQQDLDDYDESLPFLPTSASEWSTHPDDQSDGAADPPEYSGGSVSLHVLYCVYLN